MHRKIMVGLVTITMSVGFSACTGGENLSQGQSKSTDTNKSIAVTATETTATETTAKVTTTAGTIQLNQSQMSRLKRGQQL